ncbi:MAG: GTP 3',8-cyclase MoaA [Candidatus Neomarinimicrobiota bacterium]
MENINKIHAPLDSSKKSVYPKIVDKHNRSFNYLRLAVNEYCNLRCIYCMPEEGLPLRNKNELLSTKEIKKLIKISEQLGVSKIRFTGGEPLLRKDISELVKYAVNLNGIKSVNLTTNGILLNKYLKDLQLAGLSGINISLDTLRSDRFIKITRRNNLRQVLDNIQLAIKSNIPSIKINVVAMRDFNHDELMDFVNLTIENDITVRFIELMPFDSHQIWKTGKFYKSKDILKDIQEKSDEIKLIDGSNTEYHALQIQGAKGKVAIIPSYTRSLCGKCNRIRITADGKLLNCLYSEDGFNLKTIIQNGGSDEELRSIILKSFLNKYKDGWLAQNSSENQRESMSQIGG